MALIHWSLKYSVGIEELDRQHNRLVDLINLLHEKMVAGKGNDTLGCILEDLIRYTVDHFADEERLMLAIHFPGIVAHNNEHRQLAQKVQNFKRDFDAGKITVTIALMNFLKDWLTGHILDSDMKYGEFYARNYAGN
jgi:hemerythrin